MSSLGENGIFMARSGLRGLWPEGQEAARTAFPRSAELRRASPSKPLFEGANLQLLGPRAAILMHQAPIGLGDRVRLQLVVR